MKVARELHPRQIVCEKRKCDENKEQRAQAGHKATALVMLAHAPDAANRTETAVGIVQRLVNSSRPRAVVVQKTEGLETKPGSASAHPASWSSAARRNTIVGIGPVGSHAKTIRSANLAGWQARMAI